MKTLQPNGKGIFNQGGKTFCNHAVFLTIMGVDKNFNRFTNRKEKNFPEVNNLNYIFDKTIETKHRNKDFYYHKISNYWCDTLAEASRNESTGIKEVNLEEAQKLANQGYVVIVCSKNLVFKYGAPHFATIRPNYDTKTYTTDIVEVANVGDFVRVSSIEDAFGTRPIKIFYNTKQSFQKDLSYINKFN